MRPVLSHNLYPRPVLHRPESRRFSRDIGERSADRLAQLLIMGLYTAQLQYVQDQGSLFVALVNLYKALGGGWIEQAEQMSSAPAKLAASPPRGP